jgi:hypothetical protein
VGVSTAQAKQKTAVVVKAPLEKLSEFFTNFENHQLLMN